MKHTLKLLLLIGIGFALAKPKGPDGSDNPPNRSGDGDGPDTPPQRSPSGKINTDQGTESASQAVQAEAEQGRASQVDSDTMGHKPPDPDAFKDTENVPADGADSFLPNGSPIFHNETSTQIGNDERSQRVTENSAPMNGVHDVVAHGLENGNLSVDGNEVNPAQIAEAIEANPNYDGGPIRMLVCHSGTSGAAQDVANATGVPVYAPSDRVGTDRFGGPNQEPKVDNNGTFDWYYPKT